jgi:Ribbon-helix-helix protein, copG family.
VVRIQIRFPEDEHDAAKREAARLGISLTEFVRRAVRSALLAGSLRAWMRYAGMVESGDPASSRHVDDVLGW